MNEIYDKIGVLPPLRKMRFGRRCGSIREDYRKIMIDKFTNYIKGEVSKGRYPNGVEVGRKFGISNIWNFVTMTELYEEAGLQPYLKRKRRFK